MNWSPETLSSWFFSKDILQSSNPNASWHVLQWKCWHTFTVYFIFFKEQSTTNNPLICLTAKSLLSLRSTCSCRQSHTNQCFLFRCHNKLLRFLVLWMGSAICYNVTKEDCHCGYGANSRKQENDISFKVTADSTTDIFWNSKATTLD